MDRWRLASARLQRFLSASNDYVERAGFRPESWAPAHAKALKRQVMQRLASGQAYRFVNQFAGFFTLARLADVDPLTFAFSPPLSATETRRLLRKTAPPGWLSETDDFASPDTPSYRIGVGVIPRLSCLAYILFETEGDLLLDFAEKPCTDFGQFSDELTRALSRALSQKSAEDDLSHYAYKCMLELSQTLEQVAGAGFSVLQLNDAHVLEVWQRMAGSGNGITRLTEFLRLLASLTAELRSSSNEFDTGAAVELDNPDTHASGLTSDSAGTYAEDGREMSLAHPVISELLTEADQSLLRFLLVRTSALAGLYLSRARASGFSPLENKVIEAKRLKQDPADTINGMADQNAYEVLLSDLDKVRQRLEGLSHAAVFVLWEGRRRVAAVRSAVTANMIGFDLPRQLLAKAGKPDFDEAYETRIEAALEAPDDHAELDEALKGAAQSWKKLKRRQYFAALPERAEGLDEFETGAAHACALLADLLAVSKKLEIAVAPHLDDDSFSAELSIFRNALLSIHVERACEDHDQ